MKDNLTCITNSLVSQFQKHSCLRIHKICLFSVDSKELGIKLWQVFDLSCSRRKSIQTNWPSSFILSNHVDMIQQIFGQFINIVWLRESSRDSWDDNVFCHIPWGHRWFVVRGSSWRGSCFGSWCWSHDCSSVLWLISSREESQRSLGNSLSRNRTCRRRLKGLVLILYFSIVFYSWRSSSSLLMVMMMCLFFTRVKLQVKSKWRQVS